MKLEEAGRIGCGLARRYGTSNELWLCKPFNDTSELAGMKVVQVGRNPEPLFRSFAITDADRAMTDWFPVDKAA